MKTRLRQNIHPDITRPDTEIALVSKWQVDDPDHQNIAGDTAIDIWDHLPWPDELLSHSVYLGNDGSSILQYSQWSHEEAVDAFTSKYLTERAKKAHETVPGLERVEAVKYRYYRSTLSDNFSRHAGCIIIVSFETDGPGQQRAFINKLIDTIESREIPQHPGSIAAHFHLSTDGKRVLNYAEFVDEQSHEEAVSSILQKDSKISRLISGIPGLKPLSFKRFKLYRSILT